MGLRVRCGQCRRRISIDEAFAGGVCRCPYCKATTLVPGGRGAGASDRPDRPERPDQAGRPEAASEPVEAQPAAPVPLASPVRFQGIAAMVLLGVLVLLAALSIYYLVRMFPGRGVGPGVAPSPAANGREEAPTAGLRTPVVFVVDGSSGMFDLYDVAAAIVRHTIRGLSPQDKFNLLIVREEGVERLSDGWTGGADAGDVLAAKLFNSLLPAGATNLSPALREAMALAPRTVVLLSAKVPTDAEAIAAAAAGEGIALDCFPLRTDPDIVAAMGRMASATGGGCKPYDADMRNWLEDAPSLP